MQVNICKPCGSELLLHDRYRILKILGKGGFGATFLARNESLPGYPQCVIKQLRPATNEPQMLQMAQKMFEREASTLGKLGDHPQIPSLLDYFKYNQQFYLVQEYVSGSTLQQEIKDQGPLTEVGVKYFLSEILPLLQHIHSQGVIHRDIKPANIIRREPDRKLVLIDFGAVKDEVSLAAVANTSDQTALTNLAIGTQGFAPPEQMQLRPVYASDIYAVGVTCIYLLTGKLPKDLDYNQSTGEILWRKHVDVSDHFAGVLKKMLEEAVKQRYQSAEEVLRALDLEAYIDTLKNGFTWGNPHKSNGKTPDKDPKIGSLPSSGKTATQLLAEKIAQRKEKHNNSAPGSSTGGIKGSANTSGPATGINWSNSQGSTVGRTKYQKLDADSVKTFYQNGRKDFSNKDLSRLELPKINLSDGIFRETKLIRTNLQGSNLANANFKLDFIMNFILDYPD